MEKLVTCHMCGGQWEISDYYANKKSTEEPECGECEHARICDPDCPGMDSHL